MLTHYQYKVVTLLECMQNPAAVSWLAQSGLSLPDQAPPGRYPTPLEIRGVMEGLPGVQTDYLVGSITWQVTLRDRVDVAWATLAVEEYCGKIDVPHAVCFTDGWDELILQAAAGLARICGPLVLLPESGARPQIVR
jgi:hypothetical protein